MFFLRWFIYLVCLSGWVLGIIILGWESWVEVFFIYLIELFFKWLNIWMCFEFLLKIVFKRILLFWVMNNVLEIDKFFSLIGVCLKCFRLVVNIIFMYLVVGKMILLLIVWLVMYFIVVRFILLFYMGWGFVFFVFKRGWLGV